VEIIEITIVDSKLTILTDAKDAISYLREFHPEAFAQDKVTQEYEKFMDWEKHRGNED